MNRQQEEPAKMLTSYCAYLVRLWQDSPHAGWRASAQSVQTGATVRFADLEQLFIFLHRQTEGQPLDHERSPLQPRTGKAAS